MLSSLKAIQGVITTTSFIAFRKKSIVRNSDSIGKYNTVKQC